MKVLPQQLRLYAVTDRTWLNGRRLADVVAQAIDGGQPLCSCGKNAWTNTTCWPKPRNCPPCATSAMCRL